MFKLLRALLGLLTFLAIAGVMLVLLVLEPTPLVSADAALAPTDLRDLAHMVRGSDLEHPGVKTATLTPPKLDALADFAARRLGGHARLRPGHGGAALLLSLPMGRSHPLGWANVHIELRETAGIPAVASARIGDLPLPVTLVDRLLRHRLKQLAPAGELLRVDFQPGQIQVVYRLREDAKHAAVALLDADERRRLDVRQAQLGAIVARQHRAGHLDLAILLSHLLAEHTGIDGTDGRPDPVADNRAALLVLAAYVNNRRLPLPQAGAAPERRTVLLRGRRDLAQHFSISAATAAKGGSRLSHMVGLAKELSDADGGSGFSFADMLANRAGIRFAELATGSADSARHLRRMARAGLTQADIMPSPDGLPEGMQQAVLTRTIGTPSSAAYARLIDHIDRRIDATKLHRSMPRG
jgi:hypothetical protein